MTDANIASGARLSRIWRIALNAFPPLAFAAVYFTTRQMQTALIALVAFSVASVVLGAIVERRLLALPLMTGISGIATASLAAYFHSADVLKYRVTIIHGVLGVTLLVFAALGLNPLRTLHEHLLTDIGWRRIMVRYGVLCLIIAAVNVVVWKTLPESDWVFFHFPGVLLINGVFLATQLGWLRRDHREARRAAGP